VALGGCSGPAASRLFHCAAANAPRPRAQAPPLAAELAAVLEGGSASREGALCVQAVFRLLDVLAKWVSGARDAAAAAAGGARPPARPPRLRAFQAGTAL